MAINDIVQTISEARVDARSLSEFVFKPSGFKVTRRLSPTIDTLQFYVNSLSLAVTEANGKVEYIETTVQDAINNTAVEGGVLADTFVTATVNAIGSVARTQRDKNSEIVTIADFGNDFEAAAAWVSENVDRFVTLKSNYTYELPVSKDIYFNRFISENGSAKVIVPSTTTLKYADNTNEVVYLKGVDFVLTGRRTSTSEIQHNFLYPNVYRIRNATIKDVTIKALTNIDDESSWSDDNGRTRGGAFIKLKATEFTLFDNVTSYGIWLLAEITGTGNSCRHIERNVISYNVETMFHIIGVFSAGTSNNIRLINTSEQQKYWQNSDNDDYPNGLNALMVQCTHIDSYDVADITAVKAHERSTYIVTNNITASNITDRRSLQGGNIRASVGLGDRIDYGTLNGLSVVINDGGKGSTVQGFKRAVISNASISADSNISSFGLYTSDCSNISINSVAAQNMEGLLWVTGQSETIGIKNVELDNCLAKDTSSNSLTGSGQLITVNVSNPIIAASTIKMSDVTSFIPNYADKSDLLLPYSLLLNKVGTVVADKITGHFRVLPFHARYVDNMSVTSSTFYGSSSAKTFNFWSVLFNKQGGSGTDFVASSFDFNVVYKSKSDVLPMTTSVKFSRPVGESKVSCIDYWQYIDVSIDTKELKGGVNTLASPVGVAYSVKAVSGNSSISYQVDSAGATTGVTTTGDAFSNTQDELKIWVFTHPTNKTITVKVGESRTNNNEQVAIKVTKVTG